MPVIPWEVHQDGKMISTTHTVRCPRELSGGLPKRDADEIHERLNAIIEAVEERYQEGSRESPRRLQGSNYASTWALGHHFK